MAMGRREQQRRQQELWIAHTELPRTAAHPLYEQLNRVLDERGEAGRRNRKRGKRCMCRRGSSWT